MMKVRYYSIGIIISCVLIFIFQNFFDLTIFSFIPSLALSMPWQFVTAIFLHANFPHLFFNMFALFLFGPYLENLIGSKRFLLVYFISGIFGNLAFFLLDPYSKIPAVGASGAIYGILGTLAILQPYQIIYLYYVPVPMILAAILWFIISVIGILGPPTSIGHQAHLAGLLFGFVFGSYIKIKLRRLRKRYFIQI